MIHNNNREMGRPITFRELHCGLLEEIPNKSGVYFVLKPQGFKLKLLEETEGFKITSHGQKSSFPINRLEKKLSIYNNNENNILYIGKAKDLHRRIEQYVGYRYNIPNLFPHDGGRAIWQLEGNEDLMVQWSICREGEDCRELEKSLLCYYKSKYGAYPFANWKS